MSWAWAGEKNINHSWPGLCKNGSDIYLEFPQHLVRIGRGLEMLTAAVAKDWPTEN